MSNSTVMIPSDVSTIISERVTLWQKFDEAQSQFNEIDKLASQVDSSNPAQIPPELTDGKTPPVEVAAALQNLQAELARIETAQNDIQAHQAEIKKIKNQQIAVVVLVVIVALITTIFLCGAVMQGISSLM